MVMEDSMVITRYRIITSLVIFLFFQDLFQRRILTVFLSIYPGADAGFFKTGGGGQLRSTCKKGGSSGPNVQKPTSWVKSRGVQIMETGPPQIPY